MGNATSKAAKSAGKLSSTNAARRYPPPNSSQMNAQAKRRRDPTLQAERKPSPSPSPTVGPTVHPQSRISETRNEAINLDSSDPDLDLNARARKLGPVVLNPTLSHSSTFNQAHGHFHPSHGSSQAIFPSSSVLPQNPAVSLLAAREKLATEAEEEFSNIGRRGASGRRFLDVLTVRQVLQMREKGIRAAEIEERLGLSRGVVEKLGARGVVGITVTA